MKLAELCARDSTLDRCLPGFPLLELPEGPCSIPRGLPWSSAILMVGLAWRIFAFSEGGNLRSGKGSLFRLGDFRGYVNFSSTDTSRLHCVASMSSLHIDKHSNQFDECSMI